MKILLIGGDFNDEGGKYSSYIQKFIKEIKFHFNGLDYKNGGFFQDLIDIINSNSYYEITNYDVILWFPNIPNDKEKIVNRIKKVNPKCILVTSKNNTLQKYSTMDLIGRALQSKSNLLVEFWKSMNDKVCATILDPLGNCFNTGEIDIKKLVNCLFDRIIKLLSFHRVPSRKIGYSIEIPQPDIEFLYIINNYADQFHNLIHGLQTSRFLGNASYRCENGFPSMRVDDKVYVSKRNIDKRDLTTNGFVACDLHSPIVEYYGNYKPSVDTPIQLALYRYYKNIKYMIHSHVYIQPAPFTPTKIPCGALEEATEIINMFPYENMFNFQINLKGHGSIIAGNDLSKFNSVKFFGRPIPEI